MNHFAASNIDINNTMTIVSYPPTFEDLRASFLALHPDYEFGLLVLRRSQRRLPCARSSLP